MALIFIVEDDPDIREMERYALNSSGFETKAFSTGNELFSGLFETLPDLILLDIMLPNEDGLSILRRLRQDNRTRRIPVIMVTAKTTEIDKVRGLDSGADDYVTKPFGIKELVSRIRALLRRTMPEPKPLVYEGLSIDEDGHKVFAMGKQVELTHREYELLKYLLAHVNKVNTRETLMDEVWGFNFTGESRTVDMHIKTLRKKLLGCGDYIKTVRGVGYKLGD
ncbi:MAG: response regulator transcription factor [Clostridia bacterium]|nr:response regulator transcription factor [Clostridia bacterium]